MQFCPIDDPVEDTEKTQQTPKPAAQVPAADPPRLLHSTDVKQVPFRYVDVVALFKVTISDIHKAFKIQSTYLVNVLVL